MKQQLEDYVDDCFTVDTYRHLYNHIVHPISAPQMWERRDLPTLDPHMFKKEQVGHQNIEEENLSTPLYRNQAHNKSQPKSLDLAPPGINFISYLCMAPQMYVITLYD